VVDFSALNRVVAGIRNSHIHQMTCVLETVRAIFIIEMSLEQSSLQTTTNPDLMLVGDCRVSRVIANFPRTKE
jgi:hypothetical protein